MDLEFDLRLPSLSLVVLTVRPDEPPEKVEGLTLEAYEGLTGQSEVMVTWEGLASKSLLTYEVLCSESMEGPYHRVNPANLICTAFLHVFDPKGAPKYYKVRAVDYWSRLGIESAVVRLEN